MPIDPKIFEQFFRRGSSGDWVYIGYGPDITGRVVGFDEMDWLMAALPKLSTWKRKTVAIFSAPMCWILAIALNIAAHLHSTDIWRWFMPKLRFSLLISLILLGGFIISTAWIALQPIAKEFGRLLARLPKEDSIGIDRFLKNVGAVNGRVVTAFLMLGIGAIFIPGVFRIDMTMYFSPITAIWAWCAYHAWQGASWKPEDDD